MKRTGLADGILFVAVSIVCLLEGFHLSRTSDPLALHQELAPGLYVSLLGFVLLLAGVAHLIASRKAVMVERDAGDRATRVRLIAITLSLAGYVVLIALVGYLAATFVFFLLLFRIFGGQAWPRSAALSAAIAAVFYVVFVKYCDVIFPHAMLFG
jgi:hypothetical protein